MQRPGILGLAKVVATSSGAPRVSCSAFRSSFRHISTRSIHRPSLKSTASIYNPVLASREFLSNRSTVLFSSTALKCNESDEKPAAPITRRENIYTLPNFLTFTRLISAPAIGYLVVQGQTTWAVGLFTYSCITDFVDGYIARKYKLQTVVGSVIDPMADKFLMMTLAGTLAISGSIPMYMAVLILGRDFLLGLSALYFRYISLPPPKTFMRYWDFSIPSAEVHPTTISKYNTFLQMMYVGWSLVNPVVLTAVAAEWAPYLTTGLSVLEYTTATTTVLSGLSYVFSRNAVKILK